MVFLSMALVAGYLPLSELVFFSVASRDVMWFRFRSWFGIGLRLSRSGFEG